MRLRPYLTLLRGNPAFTRLFAAQLISFAGDWFATVALLGLALELTGGLSGRDRVDDGRARRRRGDRLDRLLTPGLAASRSLTAG